MSFVGVERAVLSCCLSLPGCGCLSANCCLVPWAGCCPCSVTRDEFRPECDCWLLHLGPPPPWPPPEFARPRPPPPPPLPSLASSDAAHNNREATTIRPFIAKNRRMADPFQGCR